MPEKGEILTKYQPKNDYTRVLPLRILKFCYHNKELLRKDNLNG